MSLLSPTLEAFWAVVSNGTVQDASKILGLTQTGVTQRIRSLEKQLKTTLFIRSRTGMKLTAEGEALLQFVKSSLDMQGMALSKIQRAANDSIIEVNICGPSSILRSRVVPLLTAVMKQYPKLRLHFDLCDNHDIAQKLKNQDCDLAFLTADQISRELSSKKIKSDKFRFYGLIAWKKRNFIEIVENESIIDHNSGASVTNFILEKYKLNSKSSNLKHSINNWESIASMAAQGLGYAVLPDIVADQFVKKNQLVQLAPKYFYDLKYSLAWFPRHEMPNYFKAIIEAIN